MSFDTNFMHNPFPGVVTIKFWPEGERCTISCKTNGDGVIAGSRVYDFVNTTI